MNRIDEINRRKRAGKLASAFREAKKFANELLLLVVVAGLAWCIALYVFGLSRGM